MSMERSPLTDRIKGSAAPEASGILQRRCACGQHTSGSGQCDECKEEELVLQRRKSDQRAEPRTRLSPSSSQGNGRPLSAFLTRRFKPWLGALIDRVRVHDDNHGADFAHGHSAAALTTGTDIYFARGAYQTGTAAGINLIAHELAHVHQQHRPNSPPPGYRSTPGDIYEREADRFAETGNLVKGKVNEAMTPGKSIQKRPAAQQIAMAIRNAVEGLGTDEEAIFNALTGRTAAEITAIEAAYANLSNGETLEESLRDELSGDDLSQALSLLRGETAATESARRLYNAMHGLGTDEEAIYAAVAGRSAAQWNDIQAAYQQMANRSLVDDLQDELNDREWQYVQTLLPGAAGGAATLQDRATVIANRLEDAMAGPGTDEEAIYTALTGRSDAELREIEARFRLLTGFTLDVKLRDELSDVQYARAQILLHPSGAAALQQTLEFELDDTFVNMANVWQHIRRAPGPARQQVFLNPGLRNTARANASPMDLLRTYLLLRYGHESNFAAHYAAFIEATDFPGTHEARIFSVLRGTAPNERTDMRQMPGVIEVIDDEMSGRDRTLARNLLQSNETRRGTDTSSARGSIHLERGDQLNVSTEVIADRSFESLASEIEDARVPNLLDDTSLWATVADNFGVADVWYLRRISQFGTRSALPALPGEPAGANSYFTQIWNTVKGAGTKEEELTTILQRVNNHAAERAGLLDDPWFAYMLDDELSGRDLTAALQAIAFVPSNAPAVKNDLIDAIDDEDRAEIQRILQDPGLSVPDRSRLRRDPEVLQEMGDDLEGPLLAETTLLLARPALTANETDLLNLFYADPINIQNVVTFLSGLPQADQRQLRLAPGIFFMFLDSGLSFADRNQVLAAIRSNEPDWQISGSEGTHRRTPQSITTTLPASFTATEIRIPIRSDIDESNASFDFTLGSNVMEDWTRAIDEDWNGHFELASGGHTFPLVFVPYMARNISNPNLTIFPYDNTGRRSFTRPPDEMHLFVGEDGDALELTTFSHEFGHILGNPDEYALTPAEYQRFLNDTLTDDPTFRGAAINPPPRGGQDFVGMMAQHRSSTDIYERHAGAATEIVNLVRDPAAFPDQFVVTRIDQ